MACYHPMVGYRDGEEGELSIGWQREGADKRLRLPCGSCYGCTADKAESWAVRLQHESLCWSRSAFITLTYDDLHLPWYGLDVEHLQKFLKRLRKATSGHMAAPDGTRPIRYFACGEYGGQTQRPHYHAALFNVDLRERGGLSDLLQETWGMGFHTVSEFTPGRARYIARYALKKVNAPTWQRAEGFEVLDPTTGEVREQRQEFAVMSRRKGIGAYFLEKYRSDLLRGYVTDKGGVKRKMPRYYANKLREDPAYAEAEKKRVEEYQKALPFGSDSEEKRAARESIHRARVRTYTNARGN